MKKKRNRNHGYFRILYARNGKLKAEFWLLLIVIFALALRLYFFVGLNWSDDVAYVSIANEILAGNYHPTYPNAMRLMIVYPIAFFYLLFGIGTFSAVLYPLLTSLLSIVLIFYFGKKLFNEKIALLAALLLAFYPLDVNYSTWAMGDVPLSFFASFSVLLFIFVEYYKNKISKNKSRLLLLFSGIFLGASYLIKLLGLLPLLFFLTFIAIKFITTRKFNKNYFFILFGFLIVFLTESLLYTVILDDPLNFKKNFGYFAQSEKQTTEFNVNMNYYPHLLFYGIEDKYSYFSFFFYLVVISIVYLIVKKVRMSYPIILWLIIFILYMQYGTMSLSQYLPIHRLDRHLTIITIPSILLVSIALYEFLRGKKYQISTISRLGPQMIQDQFLITSRTKM